MSEPKLPPLPPEEMRIEITARGLSNNPSGRSDEEMTAYGLQCYAAGVAAERERIIRKLSSDPCRVWPLSDVVEELEQEHEAATKKGA